MTATARTTALQVLCAMQKNGAWADAALKAQITRDRLSPQDAALCTRLVYGVVQNRMLLDFWLAAYCTQKPDHLQFPLLEILRLGAYQIVFLDKIPDSAAVNESVKLARQVGRGQASGLVNAVLRKIVQNQNNLPKPDTKDPVQDISLTYSHPKWLVRRLVKLLGTEGAEAFCKSDNAVAPVTVQVNPLRANAGELLKELQEAGITAAAHPWIPECLELYSTGNLSTLPAFREGKLLVQDGAARLVTEAAAPQPGWHVLDVCSAPGGKAFSAAMAMENRGSILACDLHENKLKRIREGADRLGLTILQTAPADGRTFHPEWEGSADLVLVDAPCSGLGIIRKKPEIRYKRPDDFFGLPVIQAAILDNAARYVKPGGTLLYSTCTVLPEENQEITDAFLTEHPDFSRESFSLPKPVGETDGQFTFWPHLHSVDGFYICRMKRN